MERNDAPSSLGTITHSPTSKLQNEVSGGFSSAKNNTTKFIRTMKNDISEAVKNQNETIVTIKIKEDERNKQILQEKITEETTLSEETSPQKTVYETGRLKRSFFIAILFVTLLVGIYLGTLLWKSIKPFILSGFSTSDLFKKDNTPEKAPPTISTSSLIPASIEKSITVTTDRPYAIFLTLSSEGLQPITQNTVKNIVIKEEGLSVDNERVLTPISLTRFFALTKMPPSGILTRSLDNPYMVGFIGTSGTPVPFLVLKTSEYETSVIGMLEWERDLPKFFDTVFGTSMELSTKNLKFKDVVLSGHDSRVLETNTGIGVTYAFVNPTTIIITTNKNSLKELFNAIQKN